MPYEQDINEPVARILALGNEKLHRSPSPIGFGILISATATLTGYYWRTVREDQGLSVKIRAGRETMEEVKGHWGDKKGVT